jgi:hypothetical protein
LGSLTVVRFTVCQHTEFDHDRQDLPETQRRRRTQAVREIRTVPRHPYLYSHTRSSETSCWASIGLVM